MKRALCSSLLAVIAIVGLMPPEARACSPSICTPNWAPRLGAPIPENAPAIAIDPDRWPSDARGFSADAIRLTTEAGAAVPFTVEKESRWYLVRADWERGVRYRVQFADPCGRDEFISDAGVRIEEPGSSAKASVDGGHGFEFGVTGPSALPTGSSGSLSASVIAHVVYVGTSCGSCFTSLSASAAALRITPSEALVPFLPVTRYDVSVDGQPWASSSYGPRPDGGELYPGSQTRAYDLVFASCDTANPNAGDHGVTPGPHQITVQPVIAGADVQPAPLSVNVNFDCSPWQHHVRDECGPPPLGFDAGFPGGDAPDGGLHPDPPIREGCSGLFSAATLLAAALVLMRRSGRVR